MSVRAGAGLSAVAVVALLMNYTLLRLMTEERPSSTTGARSPEDVAGPTAPFCPAAFAYFITGEAGLPDHMRDSLSSDRSVIFTLSYKEETSSTDVFLPDSTWTDARNRLYEFGLEWQQEHNCVFQFWTFVDSDLRLTPKPDGDAPVNPLIRAYEDMLREWEPAVAIPGTGRQPVQSRVWMDAMFITFHHEAVGVALPYDGSLDEQSWWISGLICIYKMSRWLGHTLQLDAGFDLVNPVSNPYPRNIENVQKVEPRLKYLVPEPLRDCLLNEPFSARSIRFEWFAGTPKKKDMHYRDQATWSISEIVNCPSTLY
ncbi:Uncharacterized protein PBTT_08757 [Plasmodiophora brassicae]|uniref:Uncharacterized protein n=1 Tax=Plasmodiophora brassicae TaxID=37360 RepID=A0A0G4INN4_PLABS|nr:hypothetical protein PBRA_005403 [Plasmodiophora brassicae]SPR00662.1 unnamed protein product [Plasmodiophora brassicae]